MRQVFIVELLLIFNVLNVLIYQFITGGYNSLTQTFYILNVTFLS